MRISEILTHGLVPKYRSVRINLETCYEWGRGWASSEESNVFEESVSKTFVNAGWSVVRRECLEATKAGQYLYIHPMQISGYLLPGELEKVETLLDGVDCLIVTAAHEDGDVFDLKDGDLSALFEKNKEAIEDILVRFYLKGRDAFFLFDTVLPQAKFQLATGISYEDCRLSRNESAANLLQSVFDSLIKQGRISKETLRSA